MDPHQAKIERAKRAAAELVYRSRDGLDMYRAIGPDLNPDYANQIGLFSDMSSEILISGGNRCSAEGTMVWLLPEPTNDSGNSPYSKMNAMPVPIETVKPGDYILGLKHGDYRIDQKPAKVLDIHEFRETGVEVTTKRGYKTRCTRDHPLWCAPPTEPGWHNGVQADWRKAEWREACNIPDGWFVRLCMGPYKEGIPDDDDAYFRGLMHGDGSELENNPYGVMKYTSHEDETGIRDFIYKYLRSRGVDGSIKCYRKGCTKGISTNWCNLEFKRWYFSQDSTPTPSFMRSYIQGLMDTEGCYTTDSKIVMAMTDINAVYMVQKWLLLFGVKASVSIVDRSKENWKDVARLQISGASVTEYVKKIGFRQKKKLGRAIKDNKKTRICGKYFWDRVKSVEDTEELTFYGPKTETETYIADGFHSHNSGKSMCAAALFASIARDKPITTWDGRKIETRRPHQKGRLLQMWVIGLKIEHFSTIYRLLFRSGVYKRIKDKHTGQWRAFMPWHEDDEERRDECRGSFPLIPPHEIDPKSMAYHSKAKNEITHALLPGLAEIWCFPSTAKEPRQGEPVDVVWIDEAIENPDHYTEWLMRLADERGRIFWSSYPNKRNDKLIEIKDRAEEQAMEVEQGLRDHVDTSCYTFTFEDNPFIPRDEVRKARERLSDEEWARRNHGHFLDDDSKIYPFFDTNVHVAVPFDENLDDKIAKVLRQNNGVPPKDWTHELVLDPGTQKPGLLLCAVPPKDLWMDQTEPPLIVYKEIYEGRMNADETADALWKAIPDETQLYRMIIDNQAGRKVPEGFTISVATNYKNAFDKKWIEPARPGDASGFHIGNPDFQIRKMLVESAMQIQSNGQPRLRIVKERCPHLCKQMSENRFQVTGDFITNQENKREKNDLRQCLEYWVASNPQYVPSEQYRVAKNPLQDVQEWLSDLFGKGNDEKSKSIHLGPKQIA